MKKNQIIQILGIGIGIVAILIVWAVFFFNPSGDNTSGKKTSIDNSKVVRKVGSFKITEARVEQEITNMRMYGYIAPEGSSQEEVDLFEGKLREQAISNLTDFFLVLTYAERNNLNTITDEQVDERIEAVLSQSQVNIDTYLEQGNISEDEFREQVEHQLVFERVLDPLSAKVPEPSDTELKSHFDQNRQTYVMPEAVEYQQLMVPDMATCKKAIGFLNSGKDFADVVNDFSQNDAVREAGGLMPIMTKSDIPIPEIANALFPPYEGYPGAAKIGEPLYVETTNGIFILNLLYRNPSQSPDFDGKFSIFDSSNGKMNEISVRERVYSDWKSNKNMEISGEFVRNLYVEYQNDIVDYQK